MCGFVNEGISLLLPLLNGILQLLVLPCRDSVVVVVAGIMTVQN